MGITKPFRGLCPVPDQAQAVAAPPYDVVSRASANALASGHPWSFLHISRPEIDMPADTDPYSDAVYAQGLKTFQRFLQQGVLRQDAEPVYYVWRMHQDGHEQIGVAVTVDIAAVKAGDVRRHELTRPDKENDRVRQIDTLNAQTGPVLLTCKSRPGLQKALALATQRPADFTAVTPDTTRHEIWRIAPDRLQAELDAISRFYIADGHHRSAAAVRVSDQRPPCGPHSSLLAVVFPEDQMRILGYHRLVSDLNGLAPEDLVEQLAALGDVLPSGPMVPTQPGRLGVCLPGQWYELILRPELIPENDAVGRLDVSLLSDLILQPLLGIQDPRTDQRLAFVGGNVGPEQFQHAVDEGKAAVGFTLCATSMQDLLAVADANAIMPPKSTWFEPKLADGLVSHVIAAEDADG